MADGKLAYVLRRNKELINPATGFREGIIDIKGPWDTLYTPVIYWERRDGISFHKLSGGMVSKGPGWEGRFARLHLATSNVWRQKRLADVGEIGYPDYQIVIHGLGEILKYEYCGWMRIYYQWWSRVLEGRGVGGFTLSPPYHKQLMNYFKLRYRHDYRIDIEFLARVAVLLLIRHTSPLFIDPYRHLLSFLVLTNPE